MVRYYWILYNSLFGEWNVITIPLLWGALFVLPVCKKECLQKNKCSGKQEEMGNPRDLARKTMERGDKG